MKRSLKAMLSVLGVIALLGMGPAAHATTAVLLSREELVHKSTTVARVKVGRSSTTESDDGASIVTRTELTVTRILKGNETVETIVVEQIGGTYQGKTQRLLGDGRLKAGEDAVVFLRSAGGGRFHFTALAMSVYHVDASGFARRELGGLHFVKRSGRSLIPLSQSAEPAEPVESLMTDVVRIAGGK